MMIVEFRRADGHALGADKVGECSGERERESQANPTTENPKPCENDGRDGDDIECREIPEPPKSAPKNTWQPKPNHLLSKLDTTPDPPNFPPKTNNF